MDLTTPSCTRWRWRQLAGAGCLLVLVWTATVACDSIRDRVRGERAPERDSGQMRMTVRRFSDDELQRLLLPAGAVPGSMQLHAQYGIPNSAVALYFDNAPDALRRLDQLGRVHGAGIDYTLRGGPRSGEAAVQITATVSWYSTLAGAGMVLRDPAMELVLHRLGLPTGEIALDQVADASRGFRGVTEREGVALIAYAVMYRRQNTIGSVQVLVPAGSDDGGRLALQLARRQAELPWPAPAR